MNKFKSKQNILYTTSLFYETALRGERDSSKVVYALERTDVPYPCLRDLYLDMEDTTEWEFARTYLDGWEHWQKLNDSTILKPFFDNWREQLQLKIRARALRSIKETAQGNGAKSYEANKLLLQGGWLTEKERKEAVGKIKEVKKKIHKIEDPNLSQELGYYEKILNDHLETKKPN